MVTTASFITGLILLLQHQHDAHVVNARSVDKMFGTAKRITSTSSSAGSSDSNHNKDRVLTSHPLLSHHAILHRRNLKVSNPGITAIHNIPNRRKLELGTDTSSSSTYHRRRRYLENDDSSSGSNNSNTLEVNGLYQGYGTHYVDLWVGTPKQRQTVIVDTGSGVTAFPCQDCTDCGSDYHASDNFHESQSSTFQRFGCDQCLHASCRNSGSDNEYCALSVSYQEGSMWSAYQGMDLTYVGGLHEGPVKKKEEGSKVGGHVVNVNGEDPLSAAEYEFNMVFGCQTKITKLFLTQLADGIMGMCLKDSAIFAQMHQQKVIDHQSFSLCFIRGDDAAKDGTMAGTLTMGGTDTNLHEKEMVYAKGSKTKGVMHGVTIRKIHLMESGQYDASEATNQNTKTVDIDQNTLNRGSVIVDSGTTDTYLTKSLKGPFLSAFKEMIGFDYKVDGMKLTDDEVQKLPTILIQLEGVKGASDPNTPGLAINIDPDNPHDVLIAIPPAHYVEYDGDNEAYVGRFSVDEGHGSVLGANTMRGHDVFFDIAESNRIGFALSDCDYRQLTGLEIREEKKNEEHNVNHRPEEEIDDDGTSSGDSNDYYKDSPETQSLKETEYDGTGGGNSNSFTGSSPTCDEKCKGGAAIGVFIIVGLVLLKYRNKRSEASYQKAIEENQHLNDLVLDTEIQLTEIS